jgi:hypothetical protein
MPRDASLTPRDLIDKNSMCWESSVRSGDGRAGIALTGLVQQLGRDAKLTDWLYGLTKDCPRKRSPGLSDPCGVRCPDLPKVF